MCWILPQPHRVVRLPGRRYLEMSASVWTQLGDAATAKLGSDMERGARLLVVPMPLGEVSDISFRSVAALSAADIIACEDTRKTGIALSRIGIIRKAKLVRHDAQKAGLSTKPLVDKMLSGSLVALVSDAGTPAISDPGAFLVKSALDAGIRVIALPGPSAVTTAVSVSGIDTTRGFTFAGFPPGRTANARRRAIADLVSDASQYRPVVFYESPRRLAATLDLIAQIAPSSALLVICRELSKIHEDFFRGSPRQCLEWIHAGGAGGGPSHEPRGEFTLLLDLSASAVTTTQDQDDLQADDDAALALLAAKRKKGLSLAAAAKQVARNLDLSKSHVYSLAIAADTRLDLDQQNQDDDANQTASSKKRKR